MLTLFLLLPVTGAILALFLPREKEQDAKWIALAFSGAALDRKSTRLNSSH